MNSEFDLGGFFRRWRMQLLIVALLGLPALLAGLFGMGAWSDAAQRQSSRRFQPVRVLGVQRAINNAPVVEADRIRGQVTGTELVLGVVVDGQARAYPINMLTGPSREIINDTLGGQPIAATW